MKSIERHRLKENEFARTVAHARETCGRGRAIGTSCGRDRGDRAGGRLHLVAPVAGREGQSVLAEALAVEESPVIAPTAPAPGSPLPVQQAGTFPTEQARAEAALPKLLAAADAYPGTDAGITARYHAASALAAVGRYTEAEQRYREVMSRAGAASMGERPARARGRPGVTRQLHDEAIKIFQGVSPDTKSQLPVDGVFMQLGRACVMAGRKEEAARAFTRVTEEFPQSMYMADAKRELEGARSRSYTASDELENVNSRIRAAGQTSARPAAAKAFTAHHALRPASSRRCCSRRRSDSRSSACS